MTDHVVAEEESGRPLRSPRLKDLPISREDTFFGYRDGEDEESAEARISHKYTSELAMVRSPKGLKRFVARWRVMWVLDRTHLRGAPIRYEDTALYTGKFNAKKVWRTLRKMTRTYNHIGKSRHWSIAANIKLPAPLLRSLIIADRYQVPHDVALIQMYQGVEFF
jgi:hypothetical protein